MVDILYESWQFIAFSFRNVIFANLLLSIIIIFFQRKEPKAVWAWLLILYAVPIIGFIFYLLAGTDMYKKKIFRTKDIDARFENAIKKQELSLKSKELEEKYPDISGYGDLIYYNLASGGAVFTNDNELTIFTDGKKKFSSLVEDMKHAKRFIHLQYYIIKDDEVFNEIKKVLIDKVKEGVEVRILFDSMGCRGVKESYWRELREQGIETAEFFPAIFGRFQIRMNYRNHRKIVVIDGDMAYVGGFNIGKEYIGRDEKFGYWRDTHLKVEGKAVEALHIRFILDWNYTTKENLFRVRKLVLPPKSSGGNCVMQVISSGPDSELQNIKNNYIRLISKAEKNIYIQTPYFIPDEGILNTLIIAIISGVEVHVMIPCKPDHPFVYWATYSYIGDLVKAGAHCYTYENGFMHAKGISVDGRAFCYGTANLDIRSFQLNFEANVVVYSNKEVEKMQNLFIADLVYCKEITKEIYESRSLLIRIKEQISRLLGPVL